MNQSELLALLGKPKEHDIEGVKLHFRPWSGYDRMAFAKIYEEHKDTDIVEIQAMAIKLSCCNEDGHKMFDKIADIKALPARWLEVVFDAIVESELPKKKDLTTKQEASADLQSSFPKA